VSNHVEEKLVRTKKYINPVASVQRIVLEKKSAKVCIFKSPVEVCRKSPYLSHHLQAALSWKPRIPEAPKAKSL
jgi:hypothetical protein